MGLFPEQGQEENTVNKKDSHAHMYVMVVMKQLSIYLSIYIYA